MQQGSDIDMAGTRPLSAAPRSRFRQTKTEKEHAVVARSNHRHQRVNSLISLLDGFALKKQVQPR
jgi:hypothetical protein